MAGWDNAVWESAVVSGVPRRDRRSGEYRPYLPDTLAGTPLALDSETDAAVAAAERRVRTLEGSTPDLVGISRFLLRSEAIASSRIEGIAPSARQVALAELGQYEDVRGISDQAQLVANNMTIVRESTTRLVRLDHVDVADIVALHRSLLPHEPQHHDLRAVQNWIGGSDWHPLDADFVPPPPDQVLRLMDDLSAYMAGGVHSPIVQAALIHAQFETIHPFTDGNGRVGRSLIHTVLARRGLTPDAVLPISLVFSTLSTRYIEGLTAFRHEAPAGSESAMTAQATWIRLFAEITTLACDQAERIAEELADVRADWDERLIHHRRERGASRALRSDSAAAAVLADLPGTPVLTAQTVKRIHQVSHVAAGRALEELREAGIVETRSIGPGRQAFVATDVLDTITWAERRLASTRFDTRAGVPHPGAPAAPTERADH